MNKLTDRFNMRRFKLCSSNIDYDYKAHVLGVGIFYIDFSQGDPFYYWHPFKKGQRYCLDEDLIALKLSIKGAINYMIKHGMNDDEYLNPFSFSGD